MQRFCILAHFFVCAHVITPGTPGCLPDVVWVQIFTFKFKQEVNDQNIQIRPGRKSVLLTPNGVASEFFTFGCYAKSLHHDGKSSPFDFNMAWFTYSVILSPMKA